MKKTIFWALVLSISITISLLIFAQLYTTEISYLNRRNNSCDIIHVCFICLNDFCDRFDFYTTLKSIVAYRNNPLHFHVIVDNISELFTTVLFDTWSMSQVNLDTYNINSLSEEYREIVQKNQEVLINVLPNLLNLYVSKVILIEADIFIEGDVYNIWRRFADFSPYQVVGLLKPKDTSVVLIDVKAARNSELPSLKDYTSKTNLLFAFNRDNSRILLNGTEQHIRWSRIEDIKNSKTALISLEKFKSISNVMDGLPPRLPKCGGVFSEIYVHKNVIPQCRDYPELRNYKRRTFLYLKKYSYVPKDHDVTLITHLTYIKLPLLEEIANRWKGPISAGIYISEEELDKCVAFIKGSETLNNRFDIGYHMVFKLGRFYPVNVIRNIALRNVLTQYVFLIDVDFLPMVNLQDDVNAYIKKMKTMNKKALVVPAFSSYTPNSVIPKTKQEWIIQWDNKLIFQFQHKIFPKGHGPTNYKKLRKAKEPYTVSEIQWAPKYEPYVVLQKNCTEYDERFFGYGQNKISHILTLVAQGYEFIVLPNTFLIHKFHKPLSDMSYFAKSKSYMFCLNSLIYQHTLELNNKYGMDFKYENLLF